jgi:hypothetical protein
MYAFIDKDGTQQNIENENLEETLKQAKDFSEWGRGEKISDFHAKRQRYWEDFHYQLIKLHNK